MPPPDVHLIDPDPPQLAKTLLKAMRAANARLTERRLDKDLFFFTQFVRRAGRKPEGLQQWTGGRGGTPAAQLKVAWWTDHIGRRHWRVIGRRLMHHERIPPAFAPWALWHVHPDHLAVRRLGTNNELVALCRCGVCGTPASIGWVGDCCGPCHDRLQEGMPLQEGGIHTVLPSYPCRVQRMAFTPDGRLVSAYLDSRILLWDLESGASTELQRGKTQMELLDVSSTGLVATNGRHKQVCLRELDSNEVRSINLGRAAGYLSSGRFSPDGRWLALIVSGHVLLVDTHADDGAPRIGAQDGYFSNLVFSADSQSLFFYEHGRGLVCLDLAAWTISPIRPPEHPPIPAAIAGEEWEEESGLTIHPWACSPDQQWLAASVYPWNSQAGTQLLHLPTQRWVNLANIQPSWLGVFTTDNRLILVETGGGLHVWDPVKCQALGSLFMDVPNWQALGVFSPDGELYAVAAEDGSIRVCPWRRYLECR